MVRDIFLLAVKNWGRHETMDKAASMTYYSLLSFAPIILLLLTVTKWFALAGQTPEQIVRGIADLFPQESGEFIMQFALHSLEAANIWLFLITLGILLWSSSKLVDGLERAMNRIFSVRIHRKKKNWKLLVKKKGMHFLFVLLFVVIVLLSFVVPAIIRVFLDQSWIIWMEYSVVLLAFSGIFTVLLRWLPHVVIAWNDALRGGVVLALMTMIGRVIMNEVFGIISFTNDFSVGGAIVLFLIWVHYTWTIILFGVELIYSWLSQRGPLETKTYAVTITK